MTKMKDMFRPPEPKLWEQSPEQWTPGGLEKVNPDFKTKASVTVKMADLMKKS